MKHSLTGKHTRHINPSPPCVGMRHQLSRTTAYHIMRTPLHITSHSSRATDGAQESLHFSSPVRVQCFYCASHTAIVPHRWSIAYQLYLLYRSGMSTANAAGPCCTRTMTPPPMECEDSIKDATGAQQYHYAPHTKILSIQNTRSKSGTRFDQTPETHSSSTSSRFVQHRTL